MKIAFAMPAYSRARGGAERYTVDLISDLAERGHEIHVHTTESMREHLVPQGVTVHHMKLNPRGGRGAWRFALGAYFEQRKLEADIVHSVGRTFYHNVYQPHGGTAPATRRASLGSTRSPLQVLRRLFSDTLSMRWQIYRGIERRALFERRPAAPMVIALSEKVRADFERDYDVPAGRMRVIHNGVDCDRFDPERVRRMRDHTRRTLKVADDVPILLMVAHNWKLKGLAHAMEALAILHQKGHDAVLVVCGRGRTRIWERKAEQLRVTERLRWVGDADPIEDYYGAADMLVHPTAYDPCSLVLLEALAAGLPVVSTIHNGACELITDGVEGYVLSEVNASALAESCAMLLGSEERRCEAGARARELALSHPRSRNVDEILAVYEEVVDLGLAPGPA